MKYLKYLGIAFIFLTSCSLKEEPVDAYAAENFYNGNQSLVTGINGCYKPLTADVYFGASFRRNIEYWADVCNGAADGFNGNQGFYAGQITPTHANIRGMWSQIYGMIARCNTFLYRVDNAVNITNDTVKTRVMAEARFLRAYNYFNLVRCWGEVPLRKSYFTDYQNQANIPLSTRKEIYDFIIEDLKYAEKYCWNYNQTQAGFTNDIGRITSLSATTLLAKVYLTIASSVRVAYTPGFTDNGVSGMCDGYKKGYTADSSLAYYKLCQAACQRGIAHPDFYIEPVFANLWKIENRSNKEFLFSTQYANAAGYYNSMPSNYLPAYCTLGSTSSNTDATLQFDYRFLKQDVGNSSLQNFPIDTADVRFKEGCLLSYQRYDLPLSKYYFQYFDARTPSSKTKYMNYVRYDNGVRISAQSMLCFKKFQDPASPDKNSSRTGYPILRSVDLLLMLGEANAEITGLPADGYAAFNIARARGAGSGRLELNDALIASFSGATTMDKFREFVMRERLIEFAGEGDRLFTLYRMGAFLTKCNQMATINSNKIRAWNNYYWPISQEEIDGNNLVQQYPGY